MAPFRVGILGMGRIAAGFDSPDDSAIRTHVKAVLAEKRLTIACVADADRARAEREVRRFGMRSEIVLPDDIVGRDIDALCIATPDGTHLDLARRAAGGTARVVMVEKPLDGDRASRAGASAAIAGRGGVLALHHLRRWIPGLTEWARAARAGDYGRPLSATVHYTRGLRHNGIHALDLVAMLLAPRVLAVTEIAEPIADFDPADLTRSLAVTLATASGPLPLVMLGIDGRVQTSFSVDVRFERARIAIHDEAGIRATLFRPADAGYPGYAAELRPFAHYHDAEQRLVAEVWRNVADFLESGVPLACAGADALAAYDLADAIAAELDRRS